jgi:hypothetical protein
VASVGSVAGLFVDDGWLASASSLDDQRLIAVAPGEPPGCALFAIGSPLLLAATAWRRARLGACRSLNTAFSRTSCEEFHFRHCPTGPACSDAPRS